MSKSALGIDPAAYGVSDPMHAWRIRKAQREAEVHLINTYRPRLNVNKCQHPGKDDTMSKQVFNLIDEGLREALAMVRGEDRVSDQKADLPTEDREFPDQYAHARERPCLNRSRS